MSQFLKTWLKYNFLGAYLLCNARAKSSHFLSWGEGRAAGLAPQSKANPVVLQLAVLFWVQGSSSRLTQTAANATIRVKLKLRKWQWQGGSWSVERPLRGGSAIIAMSYFPWALTTGGILQSLHWKGLGLCSTQGPTAGGSNAAWQRGYPSSVPWTTLMLG